MDANTYQHPATGFAGNDEYLGEPRGGDDVRCRGQGRARGDWPPVQARQGGSGPARGGGHRDGGARPECPWRGGRTRPARGGGDGSSHAYFSSAWVVWIVGAKIGRTLGRDRV